MEIEKKLIKEINNTHIHFTNKINNRINIMMSILINVNFQFEKNI